ncbi:MAG: hypothetical protein H0X51_07105 [Parachlamydiaceae bacterium]|nr:hypothetical protein [Parachlamydiaceae bacterium]
MDCCSDIVSKGFTVAFNERLNHTLSKGSSKFLFDHLTNEKRNKEGSTIYAEQFCNWFRDVKTHKIDCAENYVLARTIHLVVIPIFLVITAVDIVVGVGISFIALATLRQFEHLNKMADNRIGSSSKLIAYPFVHLLLALNPDSQIKMDRTSCISSHNHGIFSQFAFKMEESAREKGEAVHWFTRHVISRPMFVLAALITVVTQVADGIIGVAFAGLSLISFGSVQTINTIALNALYAFCNLSRFNEAAIRLLDPSKGVEFEAMSLTSTVEQGINSFLSDIPSNVRNSAREESLMRPRRTKMIEGEYISGWFVGDFDPESSCSHLFKHHVVARVIHLAVIPIFMVTTAWDMAIGALTTVASLATLGMYESLNDRSIKHLEASQSILAHPYLHLLWTVNPSAKMIHRDGRLFSFKNEFSGIFSAFVLLAAEDALEKRCESENVFVRHVISRPLVVLAAAITVVAQVADGILGVACAGLSLFSFGMIPKVNTIAFTALKGFLDLRELYKLGVRLLQPSDRDFDNAMSLTSTVEGKINLALSVQQTKPNKYNRKELRLEAKKTFKSPAYVSPLERHERVFGWFRNNNDETPFLKHHLVARLMHIVVIPIFALTLMWDVGVGVVATAVSVATLGLVPSLVERSFIHLKSSQSLLAMPFLHLLGAINPSAKFYEDTDFIFSLSRKGIFSSYANKLQVSALKKTDSDYFVVRHLISRPLVALAGIITLIAHVADGALGTVAACFAFITFGYFPVINTLAFIALRESCGLDIIPETLLPLVNPSVELDIKFEEHVLRIRKDDRTRSATMERKAKGYEVEESDDDQDVEEEREEPLTSNRQASRSEMATLIDV